MARKQENKPTNKLSKLRRIDQISVFTLFDIFKTEEDVIDYFCNSRYGKTLHCPHCGEVGYIFRKMNERKSMHQCNACNNSFSIFNGTIFENTKTDLRKWMYAILQMSTNAKKGLSACQLQRDISVTYKTAWRMLKQIRLAMGNDQNFELFKTIVEIDETYLGGKPRKGKKKDAPNKRGRGTTKIPVVGIFDRESGKVIAQPMKAEDGKKLSGKQLLNMISKHVDKKALHVTDEFRGYNILEKKDRKHSVVNHSEWFVSKSGQHTNNIENFWSMVDRMYHGTYHRISEKYLEFYLKEQAFRSSNRIELENNFDKVLKQAVIN